MKSENFGFTKNDHRMCQKLEDDAVNQKSPIVEMSIYNDLDLQVKVIFLPPG
jgi:hypothetical protein